MVLFETDLHFSIQGLHLDRHPSSRCPDPSHPDKSFGAEFAIKTFVRLTVPMAATYVVHASRYSVSDFSNEQSLKHRNAFSSHALLASCY